MIPDAFFDSWEYDSSWVFQRSLLWFYPSPSSPVLNSRSLESPPPFPFPWLCHSCGCSPPSHSLATVPLHCPGFCSYSRMYILLMRGHVSFVFRGLGCHSVGSFIVLYIDLQKNPSHLFETHTSSSGAHYTLSAHGRCHTDPPLTPKLLLPAHLEPVLATQLLQDPSSPLPSPLFFLLFFLLLLSLACLSLPSSLSTAFFLAARKWTHCSPRWSRLTFAVPQWSPLAMD